MLPRVQRRGGNHRGKRQRIDLPSSKNISPHHTTRPKTFRITAL
jgi:hypothetical protein